MHSCRIVLDREFLRRTGPHSCRDIVPMTEGVDPTIVSCSLRENGEAVAVAIINDPSDSYPEGTFEADGGRGSATVSKMRGGQYHVKIINRVCPLSRLLMASNCRVEQILPQAAGGVEWKIVAPSSSDIHRLLDNMRKAGYVFEKLSSEREESSPILTPKQETVLMTAWEMGYYDVPKRISIEQLSDRFGCSKSTLNVTLRTAERNVMSFFMTYHR